MLFSKISFPRVHSYMVLAFVLKPSGDHGIEFSPFLLNFPAIGCRGALEDLAKEQC